MAHSSAAPPYISAEMVRQLVSMGALIEEVGRALQWFSDGEAEGGVVQPVRQAIPVQEHEGYLNDRSSLCNNVYVFTSFPSFRFLLTMPAYSRRSNALAVKLVTLYGRNAERGIPTHQGIINVFDPETGTLQAVCV